MTQTNELILLDQETVGRLTCDFCDDRKAEMSVTKLCCMAVWLSCVPCTADLAANLLEVIAAYRTIGETFRCLCEDCQTVTLVYEVSDIFDIQVL